MLRSQAGSIPLFFNLAALSQIIKRNRCHTLQITLRTKANSGYKISTHAFMIELVGRRRGQYFRINPDRW